MLVNNMGIKYRQITTENVEGFSDFNIEEKWYENRPRGLSSRKG